MFDGRWRDAVDRSTGPVGTALHRRGITADVLTATGLVSASATAVAVGTGHLHIAIVLLILTGMHDLLDGPVAKAAGTSSVRGAFFDSVTDRVADALLMGGVAWYLISQGEGHLAVLPLAVLGVTALVSYERAKAESLGLSAKGGLMERAERMILLGIAFIDSALLIPILWIMLVLISITAVARFVKVWKLASVVPAVVPTSTATATTAAAPTVARSSVAGEVAAPDDVARRRVVAWRDGKVESRWRTWREGSGAPRRALSQTTGAPVGRWRARRQETLGSRSGRTLRARRGVSKAHSRTRGTGSLIRSRPSRGSGSSSS
jgi:CDP-diacylglycerol--glycerol-3-phosphate 3-phosphatidyltransferase